MPGRPPQEARPVRQRAPREDGRDGREPDRPGHRAREHGGPLREGGADGEGRSRARRVRRGDQADLGAGLIAHRDHGGGDRPTAAEAAGIWRGQHPHVAPRDRDAQVKRIVTDGRALPGLRQRRPGRAPVRRRRRRGADRRQHGVQAVPAARVLRCHRRAQPVRRHPLGRRRRPRRFPGPRPQCHVGEGFAIGEPCHGSAPDIEGKGIANPIATLRSTALMLEFLGEEQAAAKIYAAVDANLEKGELLSPDLGGKATTEEVVSDILKRL